jgi:predicted RNA-binding Zn-ribbon protein involved in translation (DUF1610 family)
MNSLWLLWMLGLIGTVLAAIGGYVWWSARRLYKFRCPSCSQKLHYRARQAGHPGMCPRCGQHLKFPPIATR